MEWLPLSPRARLLFYLQAFSRLFLFWVPVTAVGIFAASFAIGLLYAGVVGVGWLFALFMLAVWLPSIAYDRWSYTLRDEDLLIARGVLVRSITAIPMSRIQHVDVRQGPVEQSLGLSRLQIHTASGVGGDGVIPGLELDVANALRDRLVEVTGDGGV